VTKPFTKAQRLLVFETYGAVVCCQEPGCEAVMHIKGCDIDHHLAMIDGGTHELSNWRPLCDHHHRLKSAREHIANWKAKRNNQKHFNPKPEGKIKSRGFDKQWRKRMNGQVEKR